MKTIILMTFLLIGINCFSQNWVTNLQMRADTWKSIGPQFKAIPDSASFVAFNKLFNSFKTKPSNNANVTLDSIPTLSLVLLYEHILFTIGYSGVLSDFQTSIQPKRNTNALLDARCNELEERYENLEGYNIAIGGKSLGN